MLGVENDPRFERDGADLHTEVAVSFPQATLGDRVSITLLGPKDAEGGEPVEEVDLAPGTQPGDTVVLRGKGLPRLDGRGAGNLIAHVKLVVPTTLSPEEEAHLRSYAAAGGQRSASR